MSTYIALLKGINVGGHKKVPMVELRELMTMEGFKMFKPISKVAMSFFNRLINQMQ